MSADDVTADRTPDTGLTDAEWAVVWAGLKRARHEDAPVPLASDGNEQHVRWAITPALMQVLADRDARAAETAARVAAVEAERDTWKRRRDAAIQQCRHLHQDGKTREQWHLDNCGAMRSVRAVEALADDLDNPSRPPVSGWQREAARRIRAALRAALAATAPDAGQRDGQERVEHSPFTDDGVTYCGLDGYGGCGELWPCSTVRADREAAPTRGEGSE